MPDKFKTAYQRAREKIGQDLWALLPIKERERAVAEEMRRLDHESDAENGEDSRFGA